MSLFDGLGYSGQLPSQVEDDLSTIEQFPYEEVHPEKRDSVLKKNILLCSVHEKTSPVCEIRQYPTMTLSQTRLHYSKTLRNFLVARLEDQSVCLQMIEEKRSLFGLTLLEYSDLLMCLPGVDCELPIGIQRLFRGSSFWIGVEAWAKKFEDNLRQTRSGGGYGVTVFTQEPVLHKMRPSLGSTLSRYVFSEETDMPSVSVTSPEYMNKLHNVSLEGEQPSALINTFRSRLEKAVRQRSTQQ